jgi:glycosyltransferase involved in cell wall biosynthesis
MRICIICSGFSSIYGGVEEVVFRLGELWTANGHEVCIISGRGKKTGPKGVRLIKLPFVSRKYFPKIPFVEKIFPDHELEGFSFVPSALLCLMGVKTDIVLSNQLGETFPSLFLRIPTIMISQAPLKMRFNYFKKVDRVIVNDPQSYEQLKILEIKSELILNGSEIANIPKIDLKMRTKYSIPIDSKVILAVARLYLIKRIHLLVDAFKLIRQPATLIIIGDGPERPLLEKRALKSNSKNRIIFLRGIPKRDLYGLYQLCDAFTLPSKIEGLPLAVIDALSFGKIVVTNPAPEKKFILGKFGVYTNVTDSIEYSKSLLQAVSMKIDVSSAEYIEHMRKFNWNDIALQYEKIFHDVLGKRHSA